MTLPAVDTWNVRGEKGPPYKVGPKCSMPTCTSWADHAHHIVRRSQLGGDYPWVLIEGSVYGNLTGLCVQHHNEVTGRVGGHEAAIRLLPTSNDYQPNFFWCSVEQKPSGEIVYLPYARLDPQPPTPESLAQRATPTATESEPCPYCGQARRRRDTTALPERQPGSRRRRKTWTIKVPDDQEDGAEVLDTLIDDLAPIVGIEPNATGRYFVVAMALVFCQQQRRNFTDAVKGVGG